MLLTMFCWIDEKVNVSDELLIWVHQKYVMSQILRIFMNSEQTTALTSLLPMIFGWMDETMNVSDEI